MVELLLNGGWNFETERLCRHHPFHHTSQRAGLRCTNGIPHTKNRQLQLAILFMFYLSHVLVYQCSACSQKSNARTSSCSHSSRFQDSFCVSVPFFYIVCWFLLIFCWVALQLLRRQKRSRRPHRWGSPTPASPGSRRSAHCPVHRRHRSRHPQPFPPAAAPPCRHLPTSADICRHLPTSADLSVRCHWTCNFFRLSPNILFDRNTKFQYLSIWTHCFSHQKNQTAAKGCLAASGLAQSRASSGPRRTWCQRLPTKCTPSTKPKKKQKWKNSSNRTESWLDKNRTAAHRRPCPFVRFNVFGHYVKCAVTLVFTWSQVLKAAVTGRGCKICSFTTPPCPTHINMNMIFLKKKWAKTKNV